jgi:Fuc2NAc and GlcNAc transferase
MIGRSAVLTIIATCLASTLLTGLMRRYLVRRRILDHPNERSSHSVPTPLGGGIGIVVVFLLTVLWLMQRGAISSNLTWALVGGGLTIAVAGILGDFFRISASLRLLIHFLAAGWALWRLGGMGPLDLGWTIWDWGWIGHLIGLIGLIWMVTLYNYMDGINGLAGMEAVFVGGFGGLFLVASGMAGLSQVPFALAGAGAGFLLWNFPIARIFMGDVGSGFLGFVFGVLAISSGQERPGLLWCWLILLSVFVADATLTLIRRLTGGARWSEPHRTSAYQHAARQWGHSKVTLTLAAINIAWLLPLARAAHVWPAVAPLLAMVGLAPLVYMAFRYGAGREYSFQNLRAPEREDRVTADSQA